jgi:hypothetical protein
MSYQGTLTARNGGPEKSFWIEQLRFAGEIKEDTGAASG